MTDAPSLPPPGAHTLCFFCHGLGEFTSDGLIAKLDEATLSPAIRKSIAAARIALGLTMAMLLGAPQPSARHCKTCQRGMSVREHRDQTGGATVARRFTCANGHHEWEVTA